MSCAGRQRGGSGFSGPAPPCAFCCGRKKLGRAKPFGKKFWGGKEILAFSVVFCYTEYIGNREL